MNQNGAVVSWEVPGRLSWEAWTERVKGVGVLRRKLPWYVGDLLLYGEQAWGEKASQFLNEFGYSSETLGQFRNVAKKFPPEDRCDLPWGYHQAAAALPKRERDKALTAALAGELNRAGIRALAGARENGDLSHSNGSNPNGDSDSAARAKNVSEGTADALVAFSKLLRRFRDGETVDELLKAAGDELFEQWQIFAEKIAG